MCGSPSVRKNDRSSMSGAPTDDALLPNLLTCGLFEYEPVLLQPTETAQARHKREPLWCDQDGCKYKTYKISNLNRHRRSMHGSKVFKCPVEGCNQAYGDESELKRHNQKKHQDRAPTERIQCPLCDKSFARNDGYTRHCNRQHTGNYIQ